MYVSGFDPQTGDALPVARGDRERSRQRALLFYWKKDEAPHIREALLAWGRPDLIGHGANCLVPNGPAYGAWVRKAPEELRYDTHTGLKVARASAAEEKEEPWEAVAANACGG
jgi:hypothetical protein